MRQQKRKGAEKGADEGQRLGNVRGYKMRTDERGGDKRRRD